MRTLSEVFSIIFLTIYSIIFSTTIRSYAEVSNTIKKRLNEVKPDEWALFVGWDPELIPDLPELSATHLDKNYSSTVPIVIVGQNWHVCWANTPAMNAAKVSFHYLSRLSSRFPISFRLISCNVFFISSHFMFCFFLALCYFLAFACLLKSRYFICFVASQSPFRDYFMTCFFTES